MQLAVVGVEHKTCPLAIRESLVLDGQAEVQALRAINSLDSVDEVAILSTCGRTEIYVWSDEHLEQAVEGIVDRLASISPDAGPFIRTAKGEKAVAHLFRVAAGLESQIVGEEEVAGQVRKAVAAARDAGCLGVNLGGLFRSAVACSRRVRRERPDSADDVASAVAAIAATRGLTEASHVLVLGRGRIARMLATEFRATRLTLSSRTLTRLQSIGRDLGAKVMPLEAALNAVASFDVVCCATRSRHPILRREHVDGSADLVIFDLGVPRNVERAVASVSGVTLYDVDEVRPSTAESLQSLADSIVEAQVHDYVSRQTLSGVGPIIAALKAHVERVREQETARIGPSLETLSPSERRSVETLIQRLMDRMFHHLVVRLKLAALSDPELLRAADFFFAHGDGGLFPEADAGPVEVDADIFQPVS